MDAKVSPPTWRSCVKRMAPRDITSDTRTISVLIQNYLLFIIIVEKFLQNCAYLFKDIINARLKLSFIQIAGNRSVRSSDFVLRSDYLIRNYSPCKESSHLSESNPAIGKSTSGAYPVSPPNGKSGKRPPLLLR